MKKTLKGKRCDTDKAKKLGQHEDTTGAYKRTEALYRNQSGTYFLHAIDEREWIKDAETMLLVAKDDAQRWAKQKLSSEEYEALFGDSPLREGRVLMTFNLLPEDRRKLMRLRDENGRSMSEIVSGLIASI